MFLFFDTETNGKPKTWQAKMHDLNNWPRVAQLAWHVYDKDGFEVYKKSYLIYPQGWEIPKEKFFIDNGMATERNEKFGVMISTVLKEFIDDMQGCEYIIAHNMAFDHNVLGAEMIRQSLRSEKKLKQICTMAETTAFCELPGRMGDFKYPKLEELHWILFNEKLDNAHDADDDVRHTARCFFECVRRGIIKLS